MNQSQRFGLRRARGAMVLLAVVLGAVVLWASPASAHASLVEATPAPGSVLTDSPAAIELQFTESVETNSGAIRVYNTDANRVDNAGVSVTGNTVRMALPSLPDGSYITTWRVISGDSHPIRGAFTFQVGESVDQSATSRKVLNLADRLLASRGGGTTVGAVYGVTRALIFIGLALLIGGVAFVVLIDRAARTSQRIHRIVGLGFFLTVLGAVVGLWVYGPYSAGLSGGGSFSLLNETLGTRFGQVGVARLALLAAAGVLTYWLFARPAVPRVWYWLAGAVGIALAATPGVAGHASTGEWVPIALVTDTLHVSAMALWIGGLVALAAVTLTAFVRTTVPDPPLVLNRFSKMAMTCVGVLIVTGAFQTWRQVGSLDQLRSTDYGRILIVKLLLFVVMLVLAAFARETVFRLTWREPDEPEPDEPDADPIEIDSAKEVIGLRRALVVEIIFAVMVLITTAVLVNAAPARTEAAGSAQGAVGVTLKNSEVAVDITATPGVSGRNDIHVNTFTPAGSPRAVLDLKVAFSFPSRSISAIDVPLRRLGPGHYYSPGFDVPLAGAWRVEATPQLSEFEEPTLVGQIKFG
ncbi:MAG: copper resistance protein CopC [Actinobacteria bacterium]|nr:copper resistance protein CopC [Actinomycetota bacterium]